MTTKNNSSVLDAKQAELLDLYKAMQYRDTYYKLELYFPKNDYISAIDGRTYYAKDKYKNALEFFAKGHDYRQRLMLAANRTGKTVLAAFEITLHLTGLYPDWWEGKRYTSPTHWWVCGKTQETVAQILKPLLIGGNGERNVGQGMIPRNCINMDSMTDAKKAQTKISVFEVKHTSGGWSKVEFKSYDQKRGAYEGTERNIWFDEEPPEDIYAEGLTRTMTGDHMLMITFTPMEGMSNVIKTFTNGGDYSRGEKGPGKYVCNQTWDDVPHLSEESKRELLASYPEYQRKARSLGIPELGQGAVWPVDTASFSIAPMEIPKHWNRVGAMDFGWKDPTAMLWAAIDPESDTWYIYSEHYFSEKPPMFHAEAIKTRSRAAGFDIPMVCDPSGGGLNPTDGRQMRLIYEKDYNIPLIPANNSIEPGIATVLERFNAGKIKVFNNLPNFFSEFRAYQRDKKGKPCGNDHLMDTLRYLIMSGFGHATNKVVYDAKHNGIIEVPWHDWDSELPWNYI